MPETLNLAGHTVALWIKQTERGVLVTIQTEDHAAGFMYTLLTGSRHWAAHVMDLKGCSVHAYQDRPGIIQISAIGQQESILRALPLLKAELKAEVQRQVSRELDCDLLATG